MNKTKTIKLVRAPIDGAYIVRTVTDSIEFHPGQNLSKREVEVLCKARDWKVTVSGE